MSTPETGSGVATELAPAKINLFLHVTGKRADGYHLLDSLAVFAGVADRLSFAPADTLTLDLTGPFGAALAAEPDNLVLRAARLLAEATGQQARGGLTLEKNLPVASGIGGGSADAAAALRLLCRMWQVQPDTATMARIASALGADVPVCLSDRPRRMGGVGEHLTPAPGLPACGLLLVNPGVPLATAAVFRARDPGFSPEASLPRAWSTAEAMAADLAALSNDLEPAAMRLVPDIRDLLHAISETEGCLLARMSGSGATCFGLFASPTEAADAARALDRPEWWCWGGALASA